jgi:hypothetical protein
MKKLLLLSLAALAAFSLTTATISAKNADTTKKVQGTTTCKKCNLQMGNEKHHCQCAHEVCVQPVQAIKHAPMTKVCDNKDRCPDNTVARTNKHGHLECVETRAEEVLHKPICDTTCTWACPTGYEEEAMTPGRVINKVDDNRHEARRTKRMRTEEVVDNNVATETVEKTTKRVRRAAPAA